MKDGAVVVLYNPISSDYANICSYAHKVGITCIIDNSSSNHLMELQEYIAVDNESVVYEHHPENLGLCKGMNIGLKSLYKKGCRWALTMNPDSYFENDAISIFREYTSKNNCDDVAILAPVYNIDRTPKTTYHGEKELKRVMMSGNYLNLDIFLSLGCFYEELFIDGLDNDYCIRLHKNKYRIIECGEACMVHMPCQTKKKKILWQEIMYGYDSPRRYYGHARALAYIIKTYKTGYEVAFYLYKLFKILCLFDNKREFLSQYIKGTRDGLSIPCRK